MNTILKNVLRFMGLVVGVPIALPHRLNVNGTSVAPRLVVPQLSGVIVTADAINITVTRIAGGPANVDVYVEFWHTIEAVTPPGNLTGFVPFILGDGSGSVNAGAILFWGQENMGAAADTRFSAPGHDNGLAATADIFQIPASHAGTLRNLFVRHNAAGGNGNNIVYTVLVNGVATAITVTLATGVVGQASDLANSVVIAQGERVSLRATKALVIGGGAVDMQASLEIA